ncbi:hypothetical protein BTM25_24150 [Actinomadura rubteroloni]|uniref:Uncharacterized protein n=1 Tax=Actinomadura rubteroloni TaxID=1926885 RepID=A0A2P4UFF6_9ACTN|nr:hypothetical protein BTM25_24150 [Actinomadura rubteroloni]
MTTKNDTVPTRSVLAQLRALAREPITGLDDLRRVARAQAATLFTTLAAPLHDLPERLPALIPSIRIEYVPDVPLPSLSFWAQRHWHIHIRDSDPPQLQIVALLRELKRIIDWPLRTRQGGITSRQWEGLAAQFGRDVIAATTAHNQKGETP